LTIIFGFVFVAATSRWERTRYIHTVLRTRFSWWWRWCSTTRRYV